MFLQERNLYHTNETSFCREQNLFRSSGNTIWSGKETKEILSKGTFLFTRTYFVSHLFMKDDHTFSILIVNLIGSWRLRYQLINILITDSGSRRCMEMHHYLAWLQLSIVKEWLKSEIQFMFYVKWKQYRQLITN